MEDITLPLPGSTPPAPRPSARRPRQAGPRANPPIGRSRAPVDVHAYAPWALVAAVIILALAVLGVISVPGQKSEAWQAVFLTNGQAYFGHIARVTPNWLTLRDVHYLQTTPNAQPGAPGQPPIPDITLMKLGKELHGPEDEMRINREHVLFTEVLREDSEVVEAITRAANATDAPAALPAAAPEPTLPVNAAPASE